MKAANLVPEHNLWSEVYDFNDKNKSRENWSYLPPGDEDATWCPLGPAINCCACTDSGSIPSLHSGNANSLVENKVSFHVGVRFSSTSTRRNSALDVSALKPQSSFVESDGNLNRVNFVPSTTKYCRLFSSGAKSFQMNRNGGKMKIIYKTIKRTKVRSLIAIVYTIIHNILQSILSIVRYGNQYLTRLFRSCKPQKNETDDSTRNRY